MAIVTTTPMSKNFETTVSKQTFNASNELVTIEETVKHVASFNGKVYNGKRYIKDQYRVNNTKSGLKERTHVWQDGFGWVEGGSSQLAELFGLE